MFKKKVLPVLLSLVMGLTMLVALPTAAHAAVASIDVSTTDSGATIGGTAQLTGNPVGDAAWNYNASEKTLYLTEAGGEYTLAGTNADLRVHLSSTAVGATVTLNGVTISSNAMNTIVLWAGANCTVALSGTNTLNTPSGIAFLVDANTNCTIVGGGTLNIKSTRWFTLFLNGNSVLRVEGTGTTVNVEATYPGCSGIYFQYPINAIHVSEGAAINASSAEFSAIQSSVNTRINLYAYGTGTITATGGGGFYGISTVDGDILLGGDGTVNAVGGINGPAIRTLNPILMIDGVTLNMTNNSAAAETHTFRKASVANTHMWKLAGAATFVSPGVATDETVNISLPAGEATTISRVLKPVCEIIGGTQFTTIDAALAAVANNQTIRLLTDVRLTADMGILNGVDFTFNTNNFTLDFDEYGLVISNDSKVNFLGCAKFENLGYLNFFDDGTEAEFDSSLVFYDGWLHAEDKVVVTVNGNLTSLFYDGINAYNGAIVTVNGNIEAAGTGVAVFGGGTEVYVYGSIAAGDTGVGAILDNDEQSLIIVTGNITAGYNGVVVFGEALVLVEGNIKVTDVDNDYPNCGVFVAAGAVVVVDGIIDAPNYIGFLIPGVNPVPDEEWFYYVGINDNNGVVDGYRQYDDESKYDLIASFVWVKNPSTTVPGTGDGTALALLLGALMAAVLGTGAFIAYRRRARQQD